MDRVNVSELISKTMTSVRQVGNEEIIFETEDGSRYKMHHDQNCCESVYIEDVCGDLEDLVGLPILLAEEATSNANPEGCDKAPENDSFTWTFYRFATNKGYATIRWYGSSNGYYSESVHFDKID